MFFRIALTLAIAVSVLGQTGAERQFRGRTWSLELPKGYSEHSSATPASDVFMIGFTKAAREDGTRPLIQVTLVEMPLNMNPQVFEKGFREQIVAGVQRRREKWQVAVSESKVGDVAVTRYEWSGVVIPAADGATRSASARGVMLVGLHEGVGFSLHAQDVDAFANETLPVAEEAMRTFRMRRTTAR